MRFYATLVRPVLFLLPPELAHATTKRVLRFKWLRGGLAHLVADYSDPRLQVKAAGLEFPTPVGLSAGYDNNCQFLDALLALGFGYVVGGTVLCQPRPGHPRPRLMRLQREQSLINAMGFPSKGMVAVRRNLERLRQEAPQQGKPVLVSIAGFSVEEFQSCHAALEPLADAVELNISCPNSDEILIFQEPHTFKALLERINAQRTKPLFVKIPPFGDEGGRENMLALVRIAREMGVDGITVANAKLVKEQKLAMGQGGLSGHSLLENTIRMVCEVRAEVGPSMAINACGGISTADDALRALRAGANTVQLLTGLIYRGPGVARSINKGLVQKMQRSECASLTQLVDAMRKASERQVPNESPSLVPTFLRHDSVLDPAAAHK
ncbi:MAG: dihydroorotate dehydrogenase (quinone) [Chloroflexota bacterium]